MKLIAMFVLVLAVFTGCKSSGDGGNASSGAYYSSGFSDPWYYGSWIDPDVIATPPNQPTAPVQPTHPIAPPPVSPGQPTLMPSIPTAPRPIVPR